MERRLMLLLMVSLMSCGNDDSSATLSVDSALGDDDDLVGDDDDDATNPCVEDWLCSSWQTDGVSNAGTRTCVDQNNCGTTDNKPVESTDLPALDFNYFQCNVEPIFARGCSQLGCHGTEEGRGLKLYSRCRLRVSGEIWYEPGCLSQGTPRNSEDCTGSIECVCWSIPHSPSEWRSNYDSARGFAVKDDGTLWDAADLGDSELLIQPVVGGKPHANVHLFTEGDADYTFIMNWLSGSTLGSCNTSN